MTNRPGRRPRAGLPGRLVLGVVAGGLAAGPITLLAASVRSDWGPLHRLDLLVAARLHAAVSAHPPLLGLLRALSVLLEPWTFRAAVLLLVILLVRRGARRLAWWAGTTMAAAGLLGLGLKWLVSRARPAFAEPVTVASGYSFPSGHALNSAVGVLVMLLVLLPALPGPRARIAAWATGAAVVLVTGFDRIALGVHYLSDVAAGWLVALALVAATVGAFDVWRREAGQPGGDPLEGVDPQESHRLG